jgi:hypothetical protein
VKLQWPDGLYADFDKIGKDYLPQLLAMLFLTCRTLNCIPEIWRKSNVILIYRNKGDSRRAENYRPILLTCIHRRLYERYLLDDYIEQIDQILEPQQSGFRKGRSTLEQVFALLSFIKANPSAVVAFLDIKAAFDSVNRAILWERMKTYGMDLNFIKNMRSLFDLNEAHLLISNKISKGIRCKRGLFQGSVISPILLSLYINPLISLLSKQPSGTKVHDYKINNIMYADDTAIIAPKNEMQDLLNHAEQWFIKNGLELAPGKCKYISNYNRGVQT